MKKEVPASRFTEKLVLYDHLPNILENMAELMERRDGISELEVDGGYLDILENSAHHGRHRAMSQHYDVEQVIHEYIVLHHVLTDSLRKSGDYSLGVSDLLKFLI